MSGLLDAILGGSPDQTPDANGMTNADRSQLGFGALTNVGALLMAAGQPLWGNERARILAGIGQVPQQMQEQRGAITMQRRAQQQLEHEKRQNDQQKQLMDYVNSPEFQQSLATLPPAAQKLVGAAAKGGNIMAAVQAAQLFKPTPGQDGTWYVPGADGGAVVDPLLGTRTSLGSVGTGMAPGAAPGQTGADMTTVSGAGMRMARDPNLKSGEKDEQFLAQFPPVVQAAIKAYSEGKADPASGTGKGATNALKLMGLTAIYDDTFDKSNYPARVNFLKNVTSGPMFQNVIAPSQKFLNHAAAYLDTYDTLGLDDGTTSFVTNPVKIAAMRANRDGRYDAAKVNLQGLKDEFAKFMAGKGQLTDLARKLEADLDVSASPAQTKAVIGKMVELMHGQLEPVVQQRRAVMNRPDSVPADLLDPTAKKSFEHVVQWQPGKPAMAHPGMPGAGGAGAPQQQGNATAPYPGARQAPDGKWYVQKDGKFFEVR